MFGHFPDALCVPFDGLQPLTQWKRKISVDFMQHQKLKMFRFKLVQIPLSSCLVLWNGLVGACQDTSSHPISLVFQPRLRIPPLPSENSPLNPWASENRPGSGNCFLVLRNENHKTCNQRFGIIFVLDPSHQKRAIALATIFGSKLTEKSQMRAMAVCQRGQEAGIRRTMLQVKISILSGAFCCHPDSIGLILWHHLIWVRFLFWGVVVVVSDGK